MENEKGRFNRLQPPKESFAADWQKEKVSTEFETVQKCGACTSCPTQTQSTETEVRQERLEYGSKFGRFLRRAAPIALKVLGGFIAAQTGVSIAKEIAGRGPQSGPFGSDAPGRTETGLRQQESPLFI